MTIPKKKKKKKRTHFFPLFFSSSLHHPRNQLSPPPRKHPGARLHDPRRRPHVRARARARLVPGPLPRGGALQPGGLGRSGGPPRRGPHAPVCPRWHLERDGGISLEEAEAALGPFSTAAASASLGVGNGFLGGVASGGTGGGFYGAAGGSSSRRWGDRSLSASGAGAAAACFAPSALGAKPAAGPSSSTFAFSPAASPVPSPAAPARKRE